MALLARLTRSLGSSQPVVIEPAAIVPEPVGASPEVEAPKTDVLALVEEDVRRSRDQIGSANAVMSRSIDVSAREAAAIVGDSDELAEAVSAAVAVVDALASSFEAIGGAGAGIVKEIDGATALSTTAQEGAERAGTDVADLQSAIARIETVVGLIAKVAKQTNLLALNATIEAERAGTAGRGFAVVAQEVKSLSVETQRATDEINRTIASLQTAAHRTIATVGEVSGLITQIRPRFAAVAEAVGQQAGMIQEAAGKAAETRAFVESVAERAGYLKSKSAAVAGGVADVRKAADDLTSTSDRSMARLTTVLRQTPEGDRRRHDRFPASLPVTVTGAVRGRTETVDISKGGLLLKDGGLGFRADTRIDVELEGVGRLSGAVVSVSSLGAHVAFGRLEEPVQALLDARVAAVKAGFQQLIDRAMQTAKQLGGVFEEAIRTGRIREADLFDTDYAAIASTDPVQYRTRALRFLEDVLTPVQEALLASDTRMVFCAAVDRNGYLPVHNLVFSKPQRPGDVAWNTANCRNRRIFDDRTGLIAARNARPFVVQAYSREMGNGVTVLMKEVDAPITVSGRHWGGFRTAYKF